MNIFKSPRGAKSIPDSAEYLKDGVGNIVTTRTVDSEYLKKHPGTFAVDNGNGSYSGTGDRSGGNGYVPTPIKKPAEIQWLDTVVQSTKTFGEWVEGKGIGYNNLTPEKQKEIENTYSIKNMSILKHKKAVSMQMRATNFLAG